MERSKITIAGRAGHQAQQLLRAGGRRLLGEVCGRFPACLDGRLLNVV